MKQESTQELPRMEDHALRLPSLPIPVSEVDVVVFELQDPKIGDGGSLRIVEDEAKVVRAAFEALLKQGSVSSAAKWLNQNGYTYTAPLRGGGGRPRNRHFTFDNLYRLLSNAAYTGTRVIHSRDGKTQTVPAVWPGIIDSETYERVQKGLEAGRRQKVGRESRYPYQLSTRIYCGECGSTLIGVSAHGKTTKVPYYGHGTQTKREQMIETKAPRCNPFRVPGRKIEERVWQEILSLIERPSHREPLLQAIGALSASKPARKEALRKEADLIAAGEQLTTLARRLALLPEGVPAEPLYEEMKRLGKSQEALKAEIQITRQRGDEQELASAADYDRLLRKLREHLTEVTPEVKRRIIQTLIQKVVVTKSGFELHYFAGVEQIKQGELLASPSFSLTKNFSAASSFKQLCGGGFGKLVEPLVVPEKHPVQWVRPKVDLVELAKLRRNGRSITELSELLGIPRSTLCRKLKLI